MGFDYKKEFYMSKINLPSQNIRKCNLSKRKKVILHPMKKIK